MTAVLSPRAPAAFAPESARLRERLEEPGFRAWLAAMVRRRVPSVETDDIVQAIFCDALASGGIPTDERDLAPWICGIARNKVADFHRRAKRETAVEAELAGGERDGDVRVLLRAVVSDASSTPRGQEALEWILREHAGEELARVAEVALLPAPVVRQRVSRLRRALRLRWLGATGALFSILLATVAISEWRHAARDQIVADTAGSPAAAAFLTSIDGDWRVSESSGISNDLATTARIRVHGALLTVDLAGIEHERTISIDAARGDAIHARIRGGSDERHVTVRFDGAALMVTDGTRSVRLVRP